MEGDTDSKFREILRVAKDRQAHICADLRRRREVTPLQDANMHTMLPVCARFSLPGSLTILLCISRPWHLPGLS